MKDNYDLENRKWAITQHIQAVAVARNISVQRVRIEITGGLFISKGLLSRIESEELCELSLSLSPNVEEKLNGYFSKHLKKTVSLNGRMFLNLETA